MLGFTAALAALGEAGCGGGCAGPVRARRRSGSGDPLADRVVLWTRLTPVKKAPVAVAVTWEIAGDAKFKTLVAHGVARADSERDYTVKVDATGLKPNHEYFYRFRAGKAVSPVGRAKTLPAVGAVAVDKVVLAFVTCARFIRADISAPTITSPNWTASMPSWSWATITMSTARRTTISG